MHNFNLTTIEQKSSHDLRRPKTGLRPQQFFAWGVCGKNKNSLNESSNSRSQINAKLCSQESEFYDHKTMVKTHINLSQDITKSKGLFIDGLQELLNSKRHAPDDKSAPYSEPQKEITSGRNTSNFGQINHNRHKSSKNLKKDEYILSGNNGKNKASTNRQSNYFSEYIKSQNEKFQSENNQRHAVMLESTYKKSKEAWKSQKYKLLKKFENPKKDLNDQIAKNTALFRDCRKSKELILIKNSSLKRIPNANNGEATTLSELKKSAAFKEANSGLNPKQMLSKINHSYKKSTDLANLFKQQRKHSITYQSHQLLKDQSKTRAQNDHTATHGDETDRSDLLISDQKQPKKEVDPNKDECKTSHSIKRELVNTLRVTPKSQSLKNQSLKLKFSLNNLLYKKNNSKNLEFNSSEVNQDSSNSKSSQTMNQRTKIEQLAKSIEEGIPLSETRIVLSTMHAYKNEIKESNASNDESSRSSSRDVIELENNYQLPELKNDEPKSSRIETAKNSLVGNLKSFRKKILNIEIDEVEFKKPANTQSQLTTPVSKNNRNAKSFLNFQNNVLNQTKNWEKLRGKVLTTKPFKINIMSTLPENPKPCSAAQTHKVESHDHPLTAKVKNRQHVPPTV